MAFSVTEMKGELSSNGIAKAAHYSVEVGGDRSLSLRAISFGLPSRAVQAMPSGVYGPPQEVGYDAIYSQCTAVFLCSKDMKERVFFTEWQDKILGSARTRFGGRASYSDFTIGYYDDYVQDITFKQYSEDNRLKYRLKLKEAYPRSVGESQFAYDSSDYVTFSVSFQYRYFAES